MKNINRNNTQTEGQIGTYKHQMSFPSLKTLQIRPLFFDINIKYMAQFVSFFHLSARYVIPHSNKGWFLETKFRINSFWIAFSESNVIPLNDFEENDINNNLKIHGQGYKVEKEVLPSLSPVIFGE